MRVSANRGRVDDELNRLALAAGVLALGAAACGDDVQVVEPMPPAPPPPPVVTASMAPASASVLIGNSVVFAVNASGGTAQVTRWAGPAPRQTPGSPR